MWWLSPCVAFAGQVLVHAEVPVDVFDHDVPLARLYVPSTVSLELPVGERELKLWVDGKPHVVAFVIPPTGPVVLVVGEGGISVPAHPPDVVGVAPGPIEFRVVGKVPVTLMLDDQRLRLQPGDVYRVDLRDGRHTLGVRDASGTVIWARGSLELSGPRAVVVQLGEGRMPEVAGSGGLYVPDAP